MKRKVLVTLARPDGSRLEVVAESVDSWDTADDIPDALEKRAAEERKNK